MSCVKHAFHKLGAHMRASPSYQLCLPHRLLSSAARHHRLLAVLPHRTLSSSHGVRNGCPTILPNVPPSFIPHVDPGVLPSVLAPSLSFLVDAKVCLVRLCGIIVLGEPLLLLAWCPFEPVLD